MATNMMKSATISAVIGWPLRRTERISWRTGGLGVVVNALEKGDVLVMSLWDDHEVNSQHAVVGFDLPDRWTTGR